MVAYLSAYLGIIAAQAFAFSPPGNGLGDWASAYQKADAALAKLSIDAKVDIVSGTPWAGGCVGVTGSAPPIGFSMCLQDGPLGIRFAKGGGVTAFTPGYMAGATWDVELIRQRGQFLGVEAKSAGINAQLGPMAGPLGKIPQAGRNWEGFSPDPYLQGIATAQTVEGMQSAGVQAVTKHLVADEQERDRLVRTANIDDRVMHELYLWPFADAVHSNTAGIMCSYNKLNGTYACQNERLLGGLLKTELGFQGYVVSDWGTWADNIPSAIGGLDLNMPDSTPSWRSDLPTAVQQGNITSDRLDDMVRRVLAPWYFMHQDSGYPSVNITADVRGSHSTNVRAIARDGIVLLRNDGKMLPLTKPRSLAVIGSASVTNPNGMNSCENRGCNVGALGMGWGSGTAEYPYFVAPYDAIKDKAGTDGTQVTLSATDDPSEAASAAKGMDGAIVFVTADSGEGFISPPGAPVTIGDRNNLVLWNNGDKLVQAVAANNSNTIVVIHSVGPVILETILNTPGVRAVVWAGLPSSESGNALVDILYGVTSPSGKLPYTIAKRESDYPTKIVSGDQDDYPEGLYVDYRYFDAKKIEPRFEFGFGLSYTNFSYTNIQVTSTAIVGPASGPIIPGGRADLWEQVATVTCTVSNVGAVGGSEVAQLYIGLPASAPESPPRQLRGFVKLPLGPGENGVVTFNLRRRDLSYWDTGLQDWVLPSGTFNVSIGTSSRDIKLSGAISTTPPISAFSTIQAEAYSSKNGTWTQHTTDLGGGDNVGWIHKGDWLEYKDIDFGTQGAKRFIARVASGAESGISGVVHVALDNFRATPICSVVVSNTGGWQNWTTVSRDLSNVTGRHSVYLTFTSDSDADFVNVNWFKFSE